MQTITLDLPQYKRLMERMGRLEAALIRVWWEFPQQHPDIAHIKELIAHDGPMPQPAPRN